MSPTPTASGAPWSVAKKVATPVDIERLAQLGWTILQHESIDKKYYDVMANESGGSVKGASIARGMWVLQKKVKDAAPSAEGEDDGNGDAHAAPKGRKGGGKKRKAADEDGEEEGEAEKPAKKAGKRGKKGKATPTQEEGEDGGDAEVKVENGDEGDEIF